MSIITSTHANVQAFDVKPLPTALLHRSWWQQVVLQSTEFSHAFIIISQPSSLIQPRSTMSSSFVSPSTVLPKHRLVTSVHSIIFEMLVPGLHREALSLQWKHSSDKTEIGIVRRHHSTTKRTIIPVLLPLGCRFVALLPLRLSDGGVKFACSRFCLTQAAQAYDERRFWVTNKCNERNVKLWLSELLIPALDDAWLMFLGQTDFKVELFFVELSTCCLALRAKPKLFKRVMEFLSL